MKAIAIIPARGGSKRVPRKNLRMVAGRPLVAWSIRSAMESKLLSEVWVSTDDPEIAEVADRNGAGVIKRPPEISGDFDRIEDALLHAMGEIKLAPADIVVTLQPTSPIRAEGLIDRCIKRLTDNRNIYSVITVRPAGVVWGQHKDYTIQTLQWVNQFGGMQIPQSQNWNPDYERFSEDGSVFVTQAKALKERRDRRCKPVDLVVNQWTPDIDEESDLRIAESILRAREGVPA